MNICFISLVRSDVIFFLKTEKLFPCNPTYASDYLNDLIIDFCAIQSTRNLFIFKPFDVCLITLALHTSANPYYF